MIRRPLVRKPARRLAMPLAAAALLSSADPYARRWLVDAARGFVDPALTYTRSGAIYTQQADGTLLAVPANTPPRAYDATLGWHYRQDPSYTQRLLQTHALATTWTKAATNNPTQTATGPNGATDAWAVTEDTAAAANHNLNQSASFTSGQAYCLMAVAAPRTGDRFLQLVLPSAAFGSNALACFNLATGANQKNGTATACGAVQLANGYWLCWVTGTATATAAGNSQLRLSDSYIITPSTYTGNGTSGINVWAANLTDTPYPVPLSLATTGTVTIGAPSWTGALSGLAVTLGSEYTVGAEAFYLSATWAAAHRILRLDDGTDANAVQLQRASTTATDGGLVTTASADVYAPSAAGAYSSARKMAMRLAANDCRFAAAGALQAASGSAALPSGLANVRLGHGLAGANQLAGGIARAWISLKSLTDAQLQAVTA